MKRNYITQLCISGEKIDKILFYICMIDILFMPYLWIVSISYSWIFVIIWFILCIRKVKNDNEFKLYIVMVFCMTISTLLSLMIFPRFISEMDVWQDNIKRLIQYASSFCYYFFLKYYFNKYQVDIRKFLIVFLSFAFLFSLIYYLDMDLFMDVKTIWNNKDSFVSMQRQGLLADFRYNFTWTDPNNPAYVFVSVASFLIINERVNWRWNITIAVIIAFMLLMSMSTGAMLGLVLVVFVYCIIYIFNSKRATIKINQKINYKSFLFLGFILALFVFSKLENFLNSFIATRAIERITDNSSSGSIRLSIWEKIITETNWPAYLMFGRGSTTIIDGSYLSPHNGHLYYILAYGVISYMIFIYILFRKTKNMTWKSYVFLIPIFIGFSINILIGEQKAFLLWIILITAARAKEYRKVKIPEGDI